jgi:8-oxo-dGTP pyrophosphatase MutT (NUDIX family)
MMEEKCKIIDGKNVTCAVVMINGEGDILGVHVTGRKPGEGYVFPKGLAREDEPDVIAAARELKEETDIHIYNPDDGSQWNELYRLVDAGIYPHSKDKLIHIFLYKTEYFPDLRDLKCTSYFERYGKQLPEVDGYAIISKENRHKFNNILQDKFEIIDKFNHEQNR